MTKEKLQALGLSEKEARVYLALFELGPSVATGIAKKAGINRSTAYVILGTLSGRGLVTQVRESSATLFSPTPPEQLVRHLEGKMKQYAGLADAARKLLPDLKSLQKAQKGENRRPKVQLYEGAAAMRTVYEETLSSLETIRVGVSRGKARSAFPVSAEQWSSIPAISVYGDKIILVSPEEKFAAVVESRELAQKLKKILETARKETDKEPSLGTSAIPNI